MSISLRDSCEVLSPLLRVTHTLSRLPSLYNLRGLQSSLVEWYARFFQETISPFLTFQTEQALLPESPRYLLLKNRQADARRALGKLMSLPPDSPEVQAEAVEISTALAVEAQNSGNSTYLDCFKNNENRNGFRTWTGILMQGVRFIHNLTF